MRINEYEKFVFDFSFRSMFRRILAQFENLGELVKIPIFVG